VALTSSKKSRRLRNVDDRLIAHIKKQKNCGCYISPDEILWCCTFHEGMYQGLALALAPKPIPRPNYEQLVIPGCET